MTPLFRKLQWSGQEPLVVLGAPASFEEALLALAPVQVARELAALDSFGFALVFVWDPEAVASLAALLLPKAGPDALVWFCYPKKSSKLARSALSRDVGWEPLGAAGYEVVRAVAIDADWSALRFRQVGFIKKLTRHPEGLLSEAGLARRQKSSSV